MFQIESLLRENIRQLQPYRSARSEFLESTRADTIYLDANENALGSVVSSSLGNTGLERYPDPYQQKLKERIATIKGTSIDNIFLGNGSDEAIDLIIRMVCEPKEDAILLTPPTYGMYRTCADIQGVATLNVPLTPEFKLNLEELRAATTAKTKLCFLCSPNNPTGSVLSRDQITSFLDFFPGIVVLDEAYIDFCPEQSFLDILERYPQLVILQTLSKAWGLANLRLGMAFANTQIIQVLSAIKPPYNINGVTQELSCKALSESSQKERLVAELLDLRTDVAASLGSLDFVKKVYPSEANFLLVEVTDVEAITSALRDNGIIVRDMSYQLYCENCIRISVGSERENRILLDTCRKISEVL